MYISGNHRFLSDSQETIDDIFSPQNSSEIPHKKMITASTFYECVH